MVSALNSAQSPLKLFRGIVVPGAGQHEESKPDHRALLECHEAAVRKSVQPSLESHAITR